MNLYKLIATTALLAVNAYAGYNPNTPELVAKTKPGVVNIVMLDKEHTPIGQATGWVAKTDAGTYQIVTNAHVVREGDYIRLTTLAGVNLWFDQAAQPTYDPDIDIATMPLKNDPILAKIALPIATGSLAEGEHILVIGNPEGLTGTVSDGMVSANRNDAFQITAPISPGSSGSPVVNDQGEVVGMVKGFMREGQNLNLCVPLLQIRLALRTPSDHRELNAPQSTEEQRIDKIATDLAFGFANDTAHGTINRSALQHYISLV